MPARNSKGRFVKGHSTHHHKARHSSSRALVVRQPAPVVIRETRAVTVKRSSGGKKHRKGGGGPTHTNLKAKGEGAGWGALWGYLETNKADLLDKIPALAGIPKAAIVGAALHFTLAKKHKHADRASAALITIAGYEFGKAGFKLSGDGEY